MYTASVKILVELTAGCVRLKERKRTHAHMHTKCATRKYCAVKEKHFQNETHYTKKKNSMEAMATI